MSDDFRKLMASLLPPKQGGKAVRKETENLKREQVVKRLSEDIPDLPITKEVKLSQHSKTVSCVEFDPSGGRLVSGGYDYNLAYYDFGGMDGSMQPFRFVNPDGAYKVRCLKFSADSKWLLLANSSNTPVLMDRDGSKVRAYAEGDQYLRDLKNTNGHVAALSSCSWHPTNPDQFMTAAADGTVRIWNIGYRQRQDYVLVVKSKRAGAGRSPVGAACFNADASMILTGSEDGSLKAYPGKGPWTFPFSEIPNAHAVGSEITSLCLDASTGYRLASRATDGTVKLWDLRQFKEPLATVEGLPNFCSETRCIFSPDDRLVVTGTSAKKGADWGRLVFLDASDLSIRAERSDFTQSSVVGLAWSPKLNQIVTGNGDGSASFFFDPELSQKGILLPVSRGLSSATPAYVTDAIVGRVITPHALLQENKGQSLKRIRAKERKDPVKSHLPSLPVHGPGEGGRVGSGVTQAIMSQILPAASTRDEDPREALLRYARLAEEDPIFVAPAYSQTQPKPILDEELLAKEAAQEAKKAAEKAALDKK